MAGGAISSTKKGRRKSLDAMINLVPFIDLLSCCLSFLLITAVWSQLAAIPTAHAGKGEGEVDITDVHFTLRVQADGFVLQPSNGDSISISNGAERRDVAQLATVMQDLKKAHPNKHEITLRADDKVPYQRVILAMDILRAAEFPAIHVSRE